MYASNNELNDLYQRNYGTIRNSKPIHSTFVFPHSERRTIQITKHHHVNILKGWRLQKQTLPCNTAGHNEKRVPLHFASCRRCEYKFLFFIIKYYSYDSCIYKAKAWTHTMHKENGKTHLENGNPLQPIMIFSSSFAYFSSHTFNSLANLDYTFEMVFVCASLTNNLPEE